MTDYTKPSGTGTMTIRDTGSVVEFYFQAGDSSDFDSSLEFSWTANGSTSSATINYPSGSPNYHVGSVTVTTSQTVTFKLVSATSIGGIGGPTTFTQALSRGSAPSAPSTVRLTAVLATTLSAAFTDGANGGSAIDSRQLYYSTNPATPPYTDIETDGHTSFIISSDGSTAITGLIPGATWYFWARTHNAHGYSAWSGRSSAVTLNVPTAPSQPLLASVTATTTDVSFQVPSSNGGAGILGYQIGWGTSATAPTSMIAASSPQVVSGLAPGTTYYFFVRAYNKIGWSSWSKPNSVRTVAGFYILVGTTWQLAVAYVNVEGVWKVAEPWTRTTGVWNRTL